MDQFLVQALDAASTQSGPWGSKVTDLRRQKGAVIFLQNVSLFDGSPQHEMRDVDDGKEDFLMFFFLPTTKMMIMLETKTNKRISAAGKPVVSRKEHD